MNEAADWWYQKFSASIVFTLQMRLRNSLKIRFSTLVAFFNYTLRSQRYFIFHVMQTSIFLFLYRWLCRRRRSWCMYINCLLAWYGWKGSLYLFPENKMKYLQGAFCWLQKYFYCQEPVQDAIICYIFANIVITFSKICLLDKWSESLFV